MEPDAVLRIGDFRIERRLGSGGMGIVYLARQISLDRLVALKVLGQALNDPTVIARFQREAQAVARLDHPGIASVYFIGQDGQTSYLAMQYIEGSSIRQVLDHLKALDRPIKARESQNRQELGRSLPRVQSDKKPLSLNQMDRFGEKQE
jgi:eukaryotic-like serine/threonine-protein kinase